MDVPRIAEPDRTSGRRRRSASIGCDALDAVLRLIPRKAGKQPREFLIHRLTMDEVGVSQRMPFEAQLTNPLPRGLIDTTGRFGPWSRDPDATPVEGKYVFKDADLSTIKGIGGILTSTGEFRGPLGRIDVKGETKTPDFRLEVAGNPMPLTTTFEAVVDGTDGDTYLNKVNAVLGKTPIEATGVVAGTPGVKGRTIQITGEDCRRADRRPAEAQREGRRAAVDRCRWRCRPSCSSRRATSTSWRKCA